MGDFQVSPLGESQREALEKDQERFEQMKRDLIQLRLEKLQNEFEHELAGNDIKSGIITGCASVLFIIIFLFDSDKFFLGAFMAFATISASYLFKGWRRRNNMKRS